MNEVSRDTLPLACDRTQIIALPDARLRMISKQVDPKDPKILRLVSDLFAIMYRADGIGLAAIQIGLPLRIAVVDIHLFSRETTGTDDPEPNQPSDVDPREDDQGEDDPGPIALLNPELSEFSDHPSTQVEGCLSIPDIRENVSRPATCTLTYTDLSARRRVRSCSGLFARCVQHEIDHLNGRLFIDYLSRLKRNSILRKFQKRQRDDLHPDPIQP